MRGIIIMDTMSAGHTNEAMSFIITHFGCITIIIGGARFIAIASLTVCSQQGGTTVSIVASASRSRSSR